MKANPDRFQFIFLENIDSHTSETGDIFEKSALSVTLLGITINSKLNFRTIYPEKTKIYLSLFSDRKSICLLPFNLDVLLWIIN